MNKVYGMQCLCVFIFYFSQFVRNRFQKYNYSVQK